MFDKERTNIRADIGLLDRLPCLVDLAGCRACWQALAALAQACVVSGSGFVLGCHFSLPLVVVVVVVLFAANSVLPMSDQCGVAELLLLFNCALLLRLMLHLCACLCHFCRLCASVWVCSDLLESGRFFFKRRCVWVCCFCFVECHLCSQDIIHTQHYKVIVECEHGRNG